MQISKDIILRSQLIQGRKIHYVPGWDCHGLPIELLALKNVETKNLKPIDIRNKAKNIALSMSKLQKESFKSWGVIGNWENGCYYTFDTNYIINQLQIFWKMYERVSTERLNKVSTCIQLKLP